MSDERARAAHPLAALFDPRSIAVVGASADPSKRGHQILRALGESGYRGRILPVNPRGGSILGHQVFPSVASLPVAADLAVLCTPAASAPELVRACGERGIAGAIVLAVGFGESGPEGADLERRLVEEGRAHGVRIVGPNTSGLLNMHGGANLIGARGVRPGGIALVVQSGNMALSLMNEATDRSWSGISVCVGVGNGADLGFAEVLGYLRDHEDTRAVIVYAEGIPRARAFLEVAAATTRAKPVVMIKAARSARGALCALSHTGAVAGPYDRLRAGLAQAGVVELERADELLHVAETLAGQPAAPVGAGVAILSDGGGQGTLAVDTLDDLGAPLADLGDRTRGRLRALLGPAAAVGNPVDLAGAADADPRAFARALDVIAEDAAVGAVLVVGLFGGYGIRFTDRLTEPETEAGRAMADTMRLAGKGLVVHSMYASHRSLPLEALGRRGVPVVESLDVACRCVAELCRRGRMLARPRWDASARGPTGSAPTAASGILSAARASGRTALTEPEARALLGEHGLTFPRSLVVHGPDEAADAVRRLGGAVALKLVSAVILHKTEAGGVALDVATEADARARFDEIARAAAGYADAHALRREPPAALVTRMAEPARAELLVGATRDPGLGPVLTIGAGGVWVEALRDVAHRVLPVGPHDVEEMIAELRIARLLTASRGLPAVDAGATVRAAVAVAACLELHPEVAEVEVNPLFVRADGVEPIDARVVLRDDVAP